MANTHSTLVSLFSDIADAIRSKTGSTGTIKADKFPTAISDIVAPSDYVQCIARPNTMTTKNRVRFQLTNWTANNEVCLALNTTTITTIKMGAPVWKDNTVIGASGNQGGWYDKLWNNGSYYEGVAITIKATSSGTAEWVFCTIFGSAMVIQYAWYQPGITLYKDADGDNIISFSTSGITINNKTLTVASFQCTYQNNTWSAISTGGDVRTYAPYFIDQGVIYFGVAPVSGTTAFCAKNVVFG